MKYLAIKLKGIPHWIWFQQAKVTEFEGTFSGTEGWGYKGARTNITVSCDQIIGRIESEVLQY